MAAIVVAPLVALVVASTRQAYAALDRAAEAGRVTRNTAFAVSVNTLVHELQRERGLSGGYVGSGYRTGLDQVAAQRTKADEALNAFGARAGGARPALAAASVRVALDDAEAALRGLDRQRAAIDNKALDVAGTLSYYTGAITKLLAVDQAMGNVIDDPEAARIAVAFVDLSESKEFGALERGFMNSVFSAGRFGPGDYGRLLTLVAEQEAWFALFRTTADPEVVRYYDQHVRGPEVERAAALRAQALAEGAEGRDPSVRPAEWWSVMTVKIDLMRDVELRVAEELRGRAAAVSADANAAVARDLAAALLVVGLSLALSVFTARRMARTLRGLRDAAHDAADVRLPAVVAAHPRGRRVPEAHAPQP
ncbi:nitrate- and nitrite sensing domain-containing protein, partial [Frankia sp. CN6]